MIQLNRRVLSSNQSGIHSGCGRRHVWVHVTLNCHNSKQILTFATPVCILFAHLCLNVFLQQIYSMNIKPLLVCSANSDHLVVGLCIRIPFNLRFPGLLTHNPAGSVLCICPTYQKVVWSQHQGNTLQIIYTSSTNLWNHVRYLQIRCTVIICVGKRSIQLVDVFQV